MLKFRALCAAVILFGASAQSLADASSHTRVAADFLQLVHADQLAAPVYAQVRQMFAERFSETQAPASKQALLERYQARATAALDRVVGKQQLEPDLVRLYTSNFSETELKELIAFYQSPLGSKVLAKMPTLTAESVNLTQRKLEAAVPVVNKLLADMTAELTAKKP